MRARGGVFVEMKRLGIETPGECLDAIGRKAVAAELFFVADANIFEEFHLEHVPFKLSRFRFLTFCLRMIFVPKTGSHFSGSCASGVDLTFATHLAASSRSECQIQNSTRNLYLLMVFRFKHSQKIPAEMGSECLNWTTRRILAAAAHHQI